MKKVERQRLIRQLLKEHRIQKQEEFVELLNDKGVDVTQATISRDIKEMQLIKVSNEDGTFYYSILAQSGEADQKKLKKMVQDVVLDFDTMDKYVSLRTVPGSAHALGILVEKVYEKKLFTLITTDDKVLMIFKLEESAKEIWQNLQALTYG